jgi:hypothetical protein
MVYKNNIFKNKALKKIIDTFLSAFFFKGYRKEVAVFDYVHESINLMLGDGSFFHQHFTPV